MNKRKNLSDEQLAAYLDNMIAKERKGLEDRFNCCSSISKKFTIETCEDDDYCVEEDFADDAETLEVLKVAQDAMKLFSNKGVRHTMPSWNNVAAGCMRIQSRSLPMAGFMADCSSGLGAEPAGNDDKDNNADDDVLPQPF